MELKDTVDLMLSSDYKDRFKAECYQVETRIEKLTKVLDEHPEGFSNGSDVELLKEQLSIMKWYACILEERANQEHIEL